MLKICILLCMALHDSHGFYGSLEPRASSVFLLGAQIYSEMHLLHLQGILMENGSGWLECSQFEKGIVLLYAFVTKLSQS